MNLLDNAKRFEVIWTHRWPEGMQCPHCQADQITKQSRDEH
ncbi:transposase [Deinococcus radiomollis]